MQGKLIALAEEKEDLDWADPFINVLQVIDGALDALREKLAVM